MDPETVIAKQLIIDHMVPCNLKPHTIEITNPMLKVFKSVYSSYKIHFEDEENQFGWTREQAIYISDDIKKLKLQVNQKENVAKKMSDQFVECVRFAEEMYDMSFIIKGNGLKRKSDKTIEGIPSVEKAIDEHCKIQNSSLRIESVFSYFCLVS